MSSIANHDPKFEKRLALIKILLINEVKRIFKFYHISVSYYKLFEMSEIGIQQYKTKTREYHCYINRIVFASKKNTILRKAAAGEPIESKAKMAFGNAHFIFKLREKKLEMVDYQLDFN